MLTATPHEEALLKKVPVGSLVRHYKGKIMKVLAVARHTEDRTLYVVYQKQYDCEEFGDRAIVIRPLEMWLENVEHDGKVQPRFSVVHEPMAMSSCCGGH